MEGPSAKPAKSASPTIVASAAAPGVAAGGVEKKKKKKKSRVRGEKPRERLVLRQDERSAEVKLGRGRIRELDVAPKRSSETAMPRKLRALLAAKASLEAKAAAKLRQTEVSAPLGRGTSAKPVVAKPVATKVVPEQKRKTTRQIVIETVRKCSHQHEKKKAFHAKREERAVARKQKRKRRRRQSVIDSDDYISSGDEGGEATHGDVHTRHESHVGFSSKAQAQAPPRLQAVVQRHRKQ